MNLSICLSPCPCPCPFDWKTHWKEGRNHCDFVSLTKPLIGLEPKFDSPRLPVLLPVGHIREMTHRPKSEPGLDTAQEKTSSAHGEDSEYDRPSDQSITSGSGIDGSSTPHHQMASTGSKDHVTSNSDASPEMLCAILLSKPFCVGFCKMNRAALSKALASPVSFTEVLVVPEHYATVSR